MELDRYHSSRVRVPRKTGTPSDRPLREPWSPTSAERRCEHCKEVASKNTPVSRSGDSNEPMRAGFPYVPLSSAFSWAAVNGGTVQFHPTVAAGAAPDQRPVLTCRRVTRSAQPREATDRWGTRSWASRVGRGQMGSSHAFVLGHQSMSKTKKQQSSKRSKGGGTAFERIDRVKNELRPRYTQVIGSGFTSLASPWLALSI